MPPELETWDRPYFKEGGNMPFMFYVVFGDINLGAGLSKGTYQTNGMVQGVEMISYDPDRHPGALDMFREGYLWDELIKQDPQCAEHVQACQHGVVLRGSPVEDQDLNFFRDTLGLIHFMLENGGIAVYDPLMFRWWNRASWLQTIPEAGNSNPGQHVIILVSYEKDRSMKWIHTRGLLKFGRPDISIHHVKEGMQESAIALCNRFIEFQALGGIFDEGQAVNMDGFPEGAYIKHGGNMDDPDFNNVHIEVVW